MLSFSGNLRCLDVGGNFEMNVINIIIMNSMTFGSICILIVTKKIMELILKDTTQLYSCYQYLPDFLIIQNFAVSDIRPKISCNDFDEII